MRFTITLLLSAIFHQPMAFAARYEDPHSGFVIRYDDDVVVPADVVALLAKTLGETKSILRRAKIYGAKSIGPDATVLRLASRSVLVQTDLNRVDELKGRVLTLWNDILVMKRDRQLTTVNRKDMTTLGRMDVPVEGEGTEAWTTTSLGIYLALRMTWDPSIGHLVGQVACYAAVGLANPLLAALPPYQSIEYTSAGSFNFLISSDGSISRSSTLDSVANLISKF